MKRTNPYFHLGLAAFFTIGAILLCYDTLFGTQALLTFGGHFLRAVQPIIIGALLAYLLAPIINFLEGKVFSHLSMKNFAKGQTSFLYFRTASILVTWVLICAGVYLLASFLLPQLYQSLFQLLGSIEDYYTKIYDWANQLMKRNPDLGPWVTDQLNVYYSDFTRWLTTNVLPQAHQLMSAVSGGIVSTLVFLKDLVVGIIVSVYLLATKERCAAYARKVACGLLPREKVYWLVRGTRKVDSIFSGFVRGKLLDSLIIGILCFIGCSVLKLPYTPLVSVFVGVTNVIPFFGPFLGAIPSTFLILLVSPVKALYFVIFVFALQQLDGNVIGPKILGNKTGLSSLWVIVAILVGGSFFGVAGMFFGVPVCACLYNAVNFYVDMRLRRQGLPVETAYYGQDILKDRGEMGENTPENGK